MLPRLLQVNALTGTVESDLAIFAAALRTNASVDGGAKALFLSLFTDGTAQIKLQTRLR